MCQISVLKDKMESGFIIKFKNEKKIIKIDKIAKK